MYRIGQLANLENVTVEALRFYHRQGILQPSARSTSDYRLYSEQDRKILSFIQSAKQLGFTLNEIQELLDIKVDKKSHTCEQVKEIATHKLDDVSQRIAQLQRLEKALNSLVSTCCGGPESAEHCSILEAMENQ